MSITTRVQKDMVAAMKAGDREQASVLRYILSQLKMGEKEARGEYGEEQELKVLSLEKKRRIQAADAFRQGDRPDRAEQEEKEAAIISSYLPQAVSEEELAALVDVVISETGAEGLKDMGKVMSEVITRVAGRADGKTVSGLVRSRLSG